MPRAKRAQVPTPEPPAKPATSTSTPKSPKNGNAKVPFNMEDAIRARAYELYEQRGRQDGFAQDDWLQAEVEVLTRYSRTA